MPRIDFVTLDVIEPIDDKTIEETIRFLRREGIFFYYESERGGRGEISFKYLDTFYVDLRKPVSVETYKVDNAGIGSLEGIKLELTLWLGDKVIKTEIIE